MKHLPACYFFGIIDVMHATSATVLNRTRSAAPGARALSFAGRGASHVVVPAATPTIAGVSIFSIIRIIQGR